MEPQDSLNKAAANVQQTVSQVGAQAKDTVNQVASQAKETANQVSSDASHAAADARRSMRDTAYTTKEKASDALLNAAEAMRQEALKGGSDEMIRQSQQLARGMEKAALYLDSHTLDQMGVDASETVRQNVWQTIGIVFVVGLLLGLLFGGSGRERT